MSALHLQAVVREALRAGRDAERQRDALQQQLQHQAAALADSQAAQARALATAEKARKAAEHSGADAAGKQLADFDEQLNLLRQDRGEARCHSHVSASWGMLRRQHLHHL